MGSLLSNFHSTSSFCRAATAALVEKHSKEMMNLIQERKAQFTEEEQLEEFHEVGSGYPAMPPPPVPPVFAKQEIYIDPAVFAEVDQRAINIAQEDQKTFTDLVRQLVAGCMTDVEKVRLRLDCWLITGIPAYKAEVLIEGCLSLLSIWENSL